jgi:DNA-binding GntR family transcriptional regulator
VKIAARNVAATSSDSIGERVYERVKTMTVAYELKPGERVNEVEIARRLGASRTPLREALNRLSAEGLLRFVPGKGYFCRDLDVDEVFQLYELRKTIEVAAVRLAVERAPDEDIDALLAFLAQTGPDPGTRSTGELVDLDEAFHERLLAMSGNRQMLRVLTNVNARIRFVRWGDMDRGDRRKTQVEHRDVLRALKRRDITTCVALLEKHIDRRQDEITAALKEGYAQIYMPRAASAPA